MANASTDGPAWVSQIQLPVPQLGDSQQFADCAHRTSKTTNAKRIIVCCDGTWNNSNKMGGIATNVARLSSAIAHKCCTGMPQVVYYHRGAGTEESKVAQYLGGVLGKGVVQDIADIYRFVCDNYNPGDEIFIIGFSRGAFTARSVSGLICNLGLLNRVGLSHFGAIFHDYQNFPNWRPFTWFDKEKHLAGFTLSNYERLERFERAREGRTERRDNAAMEADLDDEKKKFFKSMTQCRDPETMQMNLQKMAKKYRDLLEKHEMILCERQTQIRDGQRKDVFVPLNVKVKAVGVWDTVGSLGWPKMPWEKLRKDRSADELRFASIDVHPNVEYAFHAIALDEWRTAFKPTLWGKKNNTSTHLRQVWFPGSHSNVGGGFEDQQIATIAMAWMADQLTSIGVEFSTPEMKRIFYTLEPDVQAREWAMGRISNPGATTSIPDQAYNAVWYPWKKLTGGNPVLGTRTPGKYKEDNGKSLIVDPTELIHPSVRIRYLYDGLGLNDEGEWECAALTKNGFKLEKSAQPPRLEDPYPKSPIASTYETLSGKVSSVHGGHTVDSGSHEGHTLVIHQVPFEAELCLLDQAKNNWVWTQGKGKDKKTLPEERIGMWERLFIDINHRMVLRQQREKAERDKMAANQKQTWKQWLTDKQHTAKGAAGQVLSGTIGRFLGPPAKYKPKDYPKKFGYHDFVSWQSGDVTRTRQRNPWENHEIGN
ncbi:Putative Tle1 phospholipase, alpha/Beta hydrolase [Colletotrichum destructivum]|uniref:Tle1 phospholipase, alpha/Beta hydrolase n=1 Tax=Colletotrichum destructivum TaxID=34406 RepID=A0AAX4IM69_9PEZI|nr:Putative Tle1 phospholipase, alpha/Beta hydrolase [Colletotrichum destructivum]